MRGNKNKKAPRAQRGGLFGYYKTIAGIIAPKNGIIIPKIYFRNRFLRGELANPSCPNNTGKKVWEWPTKAVGRANKTTTGFKIFAPNSVKAKLIPPMKNASFKEKWNFLTIIYQNKAAMA